MVYGWFEPGGGVNRYFQNTNLTDVLLRTVGSNNSIVIGNSTAGSSNAAAIYVNNNSLGVQKIPDSQYSLDIGGVANVQNLVCGNWRITPSVTGYSNAISFTDDGLINNKAIIADNILSPKIILTNVVVDSISVNPDQLYVISFSIPNQNTTLLLDNIDAGVFLYIKDILYTVRSKLTNQTFTIAHYFENDPVYPIPFTTGEVLEKVKVIESYQARGQCPYSIADVVSWIHVLDWGMTDSSNTTFTMSVDFINFEETLNMYIGQYYSLSPSTTSLNVVQLVSCVFSSRLSAQVTLKTIDQTIFPTDTVYYSESKIVTLILLDTILPSPIKDDNGSIGSFVMPNENYANENLVLFTGCALSSYINPEYLVPPVNAVNYINVNGARYDMRSQFIPDSFGDVTPENAFVGILSQNSTNYAFSISGTLIYTLIGLPFRIMSISQVSVGVYRYFVQDPLNYMSKLITQKFIGQKIAIGGMNLQAVLLDVNVNDSPYLDLSIYIGNPSTPSTVPRFIYIIPFKSATIAQIGLDKCFFPTKLGVGTKVTTEVLTVNGNISAVNEIILRDSSSDPSTSYISYSSNLLQISDGIQINPTQDILTKNTIIYGTLFAYEYNLPSDLRLKKDIVGGNSNNDLNVIRAIDLKRFRFKKDSSNTPLKRGVIAQELEGILPEAVNESEPHFIKSICKTALQMSLYTYKWNNIATVITSGIVPNSKIQFLFNQDKYEATVSSVTSDGFVIFPDNDILVNVGQSIYVVGIYDTCKTINHDQLIMTMLGAIQTLANRI